MTGYLSPVTSSSATQNAIISISEMPHEILCGIIDELVRSKYIYPLSVTNKLFNGLVYENEPLWKKFAALHFPHSFKRNPNHPNFLQLCKKNKSLENNFKANKTRRQNLPHLSNEDIPNWVFLQKNKLIPPSSGNYGAELYHEGKYYIGNYYGQINIWDANNGEFLGSFQPHQKMITGLVVKDGNFVSCAMDGHVKVWDPSNLNAVQEIENFWFNNGYMFKCCILHDNKLFLGAITNNLNAPSPYALFKKDLETGTTELVGYPQGEPRCFAAQDGILCLGTTKSLEVWDINSKKLSASLVIVRQGSSIIPTCLFIQENNLFAGDVFGEISIWDFDSRNKLCHFQAYNGKVKCISVQDGKLYTEETHKENTILWDFNFPSLSSPYSREILEENLAILGKMAHAEHIKSYEEVEVLAKTLHLDFQKHLALHSTNCHRTFKLTKEVILRVQTQVCIELLLDCIHSEDQKKVSELLNQLVWINPKYTKLYHILWQLYPESKGEKWGERAFHGNPGYPSSPDQREKAVMLFKEQLEDRWGRALLLDLGITSTEECLKKLNNPFFNGLKTVGILSFDDLHALGVLDRPAIPHLEIPAQDHSDDALAIRARNYEKGKRVCEALQNVSKEIQRRVRDTEEHDVGLDGKHWLEFFLHFEGRKELIEQKCRSPKCLSEEYATIIVEVNALIDQFNAMDREHQISRLKTYINQRGISRIWSTLNYHGISSLTEFAKKNPRVNLFTMGN